MKPDLARLGQTLAASPLDPLKGIELLQKEIYTGEQLQSGIALWVVDNCLYPPQPFKVRITTSYYGVGEDAYYCTDCQVVDRYCLPIEYSEYHRNRLPLYAEREKKQVWLDIETSKLNIPEYPEWLYVQQEWLKSDLSENASSRDSLRLILFTAYQGIHGDKSHGRSIPTCLVGVETLNGDIEEAYRKLSIKVAQQYPEFSSLDLKSLPSHLPRNIFYLPSVVI